MLKKCLEEKDRLHTKVINLANKVKEQEKQLKHMVDEASVELEGSGKGKRSYSIFSYSKKEELQKPSNFQATQISKIIWCTFDVYVHTNIVVI